MWAHGCDLSFDMGAFKNEACWLAGSLPGGVAMCGPFGTTRGSGPLELRADRHRRCGRYLCRPGFVDQRGFVQWCCLRGAHWCSLQEILQRDRGTHLLEGFRHVKSQLTSLPSLSLMPGHSWLVYIWSRPVATRTTAAKLHLLLEHVYKQLQGIASA